MMVETNLKLSIRGFELAIEKWAIDIEKSGKKALRFYKDSYLIGTTPSDNARQWIKDFNNIIKCNQQVLYDFYRECDKDISVKMVKK